LEAPGVEMGYPVLIPGESGFQWGETAKQGRFFGNVKINFDFNRRKTIFSGEDGKMN
jgi:hypothetical protein